MFANDCSTIVTNYSIYLCVNLAYNQEMVQPFNKTTNFANAYKIRDRRLIPLRFNPQDSRRFIKVIYEKSAERLHSFTSCRLKLIYTNFSFNVSIVRRIKRYFTTNLISTQKIGLHENGK